MALGASISSIFHSSLNTAMGDDQRGESSQQIMRTLVLKLENSGVGPAKV